MEVSFKTESKKRKRKKRKHQPSNNLENATVNPANFDGVSNWLKLRKVLETVAKERVPENTSAADTKPAANKKQLKKKPEKDSVQNNLKKKPEKDCVQNNLHKKARIDQKPQYKFDFTERSTSLLPARTSSEPEPFCRGKSKMKSMPANSRASVNVNEDDTIRLTKTVGMDCEMVGTGPDGADSILARVSIVNSFGECIYDTFVKNKEKVTDYRTEISGVRPADVKNGKDLFDVQKDVLTILEGRKIVGHDLKHDFNVLFISHPKGMVRDTAKYKPFREVSGGRTPSLRKLTAVFLGCDIQSGEHSSIEDAQAAMLLYLRHKSEWEKSIKSTRRKKGAH